MIPRNDDTRAWRGGPVALLGLAAAFVAAVMLPRSAAAQVIVGATGEVAVNTTTAGDQELPALSRGGDGGFVVVWQGPAQAGASPAVFARRFAADATPVGSEFQVGADTSRSHVSPCVARNADGSFVVAWSTTVTPAGDGSELSVYGQRFDASGAVDGSEFQINTYTTGAQSAPSVAAPGDGSFVVIWDSEGQDGDGDGIFGQRFDAVGLPVGSEFQINTYTTGSQQAPAVCADDGGSFVVAWQSEGQDGSELGVFARRFDDAGNPLGAEFRVNSTTSRSQSAPSLACEPGGGFVVAWTAGYQDPDSSAGIRAKKFDAGGNTLTTELAVNTYTTGGQVNPSVSAAADGRFVVTWTSIGMTGGYPSLDLTVAGQLFGPFGLRVGPEFEVNSYTTGRQQLPRVGFGADDDFVVVWQSDTPLGTGQDGSGSGVFGRRFTIDLSATTTTTTSTTTTTTTSTTITTSTSTTLVAPTTTSTSTTSTTIAPTTTSTTLAPPTTTSTTSTSLPAPVKCGDATADGATTASDALEALRTAVGTGSCPACICDATGDEQITATDALRILQSAVGQKVALDCPPC